MADAENKTAQAEEDEGKSKDFYYDYLQYQSGSHVEEDSGIPSDILKLFHSFGYDSKKRANLHLLPGPTALFAAGNLVVLLDLHSGKHTYIRSCSGGGIGALAVHPSQKYFAIAEKGKKPHILIYEYPSLKLYRILQGGTEQTYSFIDFNPKGELLASVGSAPDFMLTVWDWMKENIMLRSKAFSQDIYCVKFSPEQEGQLTSSGTGHIRFWKMAKTFTGLKLKGELGRFGKTSLTDIDGYVQLPDGKVLSGTEWGNMLLWDGGLIKVEICRKQKHPCHEGIITQLVMDEGELITIGLDGYVRVWEMESIDTADTTDDSDVFEIEPMNELLVGNDVQLTRMVKFNDEKHEESSDELASIWFAQDANGGIWKLDLSFSHTTKPPEKLYSHIGGMVYGMATSPCSHLLAVTGDVSLNLYDYLTYKHLCTFRSPANSKGRCIYWPGKMIDSKGSTVIAGYSDGVVRVLTLQREEEATQFVLKQVVKPHTSDVTVVVPDSTNEILATGSRDGTVFFFSIADELQPIGFVNVSGPVTHMQWSPDGYEKSSLLVSCENGYVVEVMSPVSQTFDTSHSFKLSTIPLRYYKFQSVKSQLRRDEERERRDEAKKLRRQKREKDLKRRKDAGEEISDEDAETFLETDDFEEPAEEALFIPSEPCPVLHAFYSQPDHFVVSMGGYDAGYLYECKFNDDDGKSQNPEIEEAGPVKAIPVHGSNDIPITSILLSNDLGHVFAGLEDGSVRVYPLAEKRDPSIFDIETLDAKHWQLNVHDNNTGHVCNIVESHDFAYLFTSGGDGNVFGFNVLPYEDVYESMQGMRARLPSAKQPSPDEKSIDDIDDPQAYSIEDAKLKAEHDKMMREAEAKKMAERRRINKLRRTFKELLQKNHDLPNNVQLARNEFELDPSIRHKMEQSTDEKIERVKLEMQWDKERHALAYRKLHDRFKASIECDRITVHAFKTDHSLSSYRVAKLSEEYHQMRKEMEQRVRSNSLASETGSDRLSANGMGTVRGSISSDHEGEQDTFLKGTKQKRQSILHGRQAEKVAKALKKAEESKKKRERRQKEWEDLHKNKPDANHEDPHDVAAIEEAKANIGDFKLKTSSDYAVPEHLRMDTEKKRYQILVLQGLIYEVKSTFNTRLLDLRDEKVSLIDRIREKVSQLKQVQDLLPPEHRRKIPRVPKMKPDEMPHKKYEYTRDTLLKFQEQEQSRIDAAAAKKREGEGFGGFGGFGGGQEEEEGEDVRTRTYTTGSRTSSVGLAQKQAEKVKTSTEIKLEKMEQIKARYQRDRLLKEIVEDLEMFDAELKLLRHEKTSLDANIKMADLRQITLLEELILLKEYEKRELNLSGRVNSRRNELADINNKVAEMQMKFESKRRDIEKLSDREKALYATFTSSLGDNNKFADFLTKVFKKKIKRTKKKVGSGEDGEGDSDESSDEESDWSSDEDEDDSMEGGLDDSVCPPGCDQQLFNDILMLREKRLDLEEALVEEKKIADQLKKDAEAQAKKSKIMENQLKSALADLAAFQVEKQGKLNELNIVVPLRLHQVEHVLNGSVPSDLSLCLVFPNTALTALQRRIKELQLEKTEQKSLYKDARQQHVRLIKERKLFEAKIEKLEDKCEQMMMLKFGRIVDLDKLETITVNKTVEELKEKIRLNDVSNTRQLSKWDKRIAQLKDRITYLTRENTARLESLNVMIGDKANLEIALNKRQKNMEFDTRFEKKSDVRERQRLVQLVQLQAQEIQALKEEIGLLSRKGGHILPPAQPPLGQDQEVM